MRSAGNFNPEWGYLAPAPSFMRTARAVLVATAIGATAGAAVVIALIDRPADDAGKTRSIAAHAIVTSVQAAAAPTTPPAAAATASIAAPIAATAPPAAAAATVSVAVPVATATTPAAEPQLPVPQQMTPQVKPQRSPQVATQPASAAATHAAAVVPAVEDGRAGDAIVAPKPADAIAAPKPAPGMTALSEAAPATGAADTPDQSLTPPQTVPPEKKTRRHVASGYEPNNQAPSLGTVLRRIFSPQGGSSYYPNR